MENNLVQVTLVKDIYPGINNYGRNNSSYPDDLTEFNGKLYFTANDGENGNELWVSDGTDQGTQLLIDIRPGNSDYDYGDNNPLGSFPDKLTEFDGKLYFTADDGENGNELWVSDGTAAGTQLLVDLRPDSSDYINSSNARDFTEFDGKLYFSADDGENGRELWVSDGTEAGTQLLVDISPESDGSYPSGFTEFNDKLYFSADDGENGSELWVSDGTEAGTQLLIDISPRDNSYGNPYSSYSSYPYESIKFDGKLYFSADNGKNGRELWVSDGTEAGTQLLIDIRLDSGDYDGFNYGSNPRNFTEFNGKLYFTADDGENGRELWVSDGTNEGTQLLLDIAPGSNGSNPYNLTEFNDKLYFTVKNGDEIWVSDGTEAGTELAADISSVGSYDPFSSDPDELTVFNGRLYFTANDGENGNELWVSDGTEAGTQLAVDILPGSDDDGYIYSSNARNLTEVNDLLYFSVDDEENGRELWVSDGTEAGTQLLIDIRPGSDNGYGYSSFPYNLTEFNDKLYFTANDGENGNELWVSDGTEAGTQLLVDIRPGSDSYAYGDSSSDVSNLTVFNDLLYFRADDGESGNELWVSDGTEAGTQLLVDIRPGSYGSIDSYYSYDYGLTEFNDKLYFTANDGENGNKIWVSDGTAEGTQLLINIRPGSDNSGYSYGSAKNLTEVDGKLFFTANDRENGRELWVSNGTAEGTQLLIDIRPNRDDGYTYSSNPRNLTEFNDRLYFTANDGENGNELWVSDGTVEGTEMLIDIRPGGFVNSNSSYADNLTVFNGRLYFTADDGENGRELWVTDGTTAGTQLVADVAPGGDYDPSYSSLASYLTVVDDELFFSARDGINGNELFKLTVDDSINIISGTNRSDNLVGTDGADEIEGLNGKDTIDGGAGNDTLLGGNKKDSLIGGAGDDSLVGDNGKDTLEGGAGNDTLIGGNSEDLLVGGAGNDSLVGDNSKDTLDGGAGNDTITGGAGRDIFILRPGEGEDTIADFHLGRDRIGLGGSLEFEALTFSGNTIEMGEEVLATLNGVNTEHLTEHDFLTL